MAKINGEFTSTDAAKAKWVTSQIQNEVIDACVQIFGGYGYMNEYRIAGPGKTRESQRSGRARTKS